MMRQYELVERVLKYDPERGRGAAQSRLRLCHEGARQPEARLGRSVFLPPARSGRDPHRSQARRRHDRHGAAARRHRGHRGVTRTEIDQKFGEEIGALVDGLTKIKKLDLVTKKAEQAENFRKLLVAISSDIRVLLIKLADRLHNMRTLGAHEAGEPPARLRGDARDLCAAGRPHGHAGHARGAGGAGLQVGQSRRLPGRARQA